MIGINKKIGDSKIIIYSSKDGEAKLEVRLENETVWLWLNQIAKLFDTDKSGISRHIQNIYNNKKLDKKPTVAKIATVQKEGQRTIKRYVEYL